MCVCVWGGGGVIRGNKNENKSKGLVADNCEDAKKAFETSISTTSSADEKHTRSAIIW